MDAQLIRRQFPALEGAGITFLDSASTTQKPRRVIEEVTRYLSAETASPGRGSYPWAARLNARVESVRERVAEFLGAQDPAEIVFTSGATASLNAVAVSWALDNVSDGDEILYSPWDHTSNVLPWQQVQRRLAGFGRRVHLIPYAMTATGELDQQDLLAKVGPRTRMIAVSHVHNLFGSMTCLGSLRRVVPESVLFCYDASQSVGHLPVDVEELSADFLAFSAHKMFGISGTGVLYCRRRTHPKLSPFLPGGGFEAWAEVVGGPVPEMPALLEGGTANTAGILALGAALEFVEEIGVDVIAEHDRDLALLVRDRLGEIPEVDLLPGPFRAAEEGHGIVSFHVGGARPEDIGFALASAGVYVRAGRHCLAGPSPYRDAVRASTHAYTTRADVDRLADELRRLLKEAP